MWRGGEREGKVEDVDVCVYTHVVQEYNSCSHQYQRLDRRGAWVMVLRTGVFHA